MDFSHILRTSIADKKKLLDFGFTEENQCFTLKKSLPIDNFFSIIRIEPEKITVSVFDSLTKDRYGLVDAPFATGAFIGELRKSVDALMKEITATCFISTDYYQNYVSYLLNDFDSRQDFPWDGDDASVFRCPNNKWFALLMNISFKSLGFQSEDKVWVVNLKIKKEKVPELIDNKSIFPAYHMTKTHWVTVLLTSATDFERLKQLTEESYRLVLTSKKCQ